MTGLPSHPAALHDAACLTAELLKTRSSVSVSQRHTADHLIKLKTSLAISPIKSHGFTCRVLTGIFCSGYASAVGSTAAAHAPGFWHCADHDSSRDRPG